MYISALSLKNYKSFNNIKFEFNEKFNIIIGENNIGKSSIFEAFLLWKTIYNLFIKSTSGRKKFYSLTTPMYLNFSDLNQIRIIDDDLFFDKKNKEAAITVTIADETSTFNLEIRFEKPTIKNSYFRVYRNEEFDSFAEYIKENKNCSLQDAIFIYQTRPLSTIYRNEPFYNNGQIEAKINLGKSHDILRNKILKTEKSGDVRVDEKFESLERRINNILETNYKFRFKNKNKIDDEFVRISVIKEDNKELDISLMGSGFLQVVEIFSTLEYIHKMSDGVCLILIDEPDSHLHANIQINLMNQLRNTQRNNQIFVISHNDRLISEAKSGELFYLNDTAKNNGILKSVDKNLYDTVKSELGADFFDKKLPIIITEGKTDKMILETAWVKLYPSKEIPFKILPCGTNHIDESQRDGGADQLRRTLEFLSTVHDGIVIGIFDNDREGIEQIKGLNKQIFEDFQCDKNIIRKHKTKLFYGISLPVPSKRELFVTKDDIIQRYLSIELYFNDEILNNYHLKGHSILETEVFNLNSKNKNNFADNCNSLDAQEFKDFEVVFNQIQSIIQG